MTTYYEVKSTNMTHLEPQPHINRLLMKKKLDVHVTTFGEELISHSVTCVNTCDFTVIQLSLGIEPNFFKYP